MFKKKLQRWVGDVALRDIVSGHSGDVLVVGVDNLSGFLPSIMILWFSVKCAQWESEEPFVLQSTQKIQAYNGMISIFFQVEGSLTVFIFFLRRSYSGEELNLCTYYSCCSKSALQPCRPGIEQNWILLLYKCFWIYIYFATFCKSATYMSFINNWLTSFLFYFICKIIETCLQLRHFNITLEEL